MTKEMRQGLGALCVAAAVLVLGLALTQADGTTATIGEVLRAAGVIIGLVGLAILAMQLLRGRT
jgi:hypothetical protein